MSLDAVVDYLHYVCGLNRESPSRLMSGMCWAWKKVETGHQIVCSTCLTVWPDGMGRTPRQTMLRESASGASRRVSSERSRSTRWSSAESCAVAKR